MRQLQGTTFTSVKIYALECTTGVVHRRIHSCMPSGAKRQQCSLIFLTRKVTARIDECRNTTSLSHSSITHLWNTFALTFHHFERGIRWFIRLLADLFALHAWFFVFVPYNFHYNSLLVIKKSLEWNSQIPKINRQNYVEKWQNDGFGSKLI